MICWNWVSSKPVRTILPVKLQPPRLKVVASSLRFPARGYFYSSVDLCLHPYYNLLNWNLDFSGVLQKTCFGEAYPGEREANMLSNTSCVFGVVSCCLGTQQRCGAASHSKAMASRIVATTKQGSKHIHTFLEEAAPTRSLPQHFVHCRRLARFLAVLGIRGSRGK